MGSDSKFSFLLRGPRSLFSALEKEAAARNLSVNQLCLARLKGDEQAPMARSRIPIAAGGIVGEIQDFVQTALIKPFGDDLQSVALFGSAARGEMKSSSDIDLLVVLSDKLSLDRDVYSLVPAGAVTGHEISPLIVQLPRSDEELRSVWLEAAIDGIILFDPDLSLARTLSRVRALMASGLIERRMSHGVPYWIHKQGPKGHPGGGTNG